ncbi:MAG: peptidase family protein [Ilumatobacteraceae bacterium]|nr:peptidase family protein [Ilumatobacteraceae bacterium]
MGSVLVLLMATVAPACYVPPVSSPITEPFLAPACAYCPGHRGVEYATTAGTRVHAVAPGVVTFAGVVAGVRYVVVMHPDGIAATYGDLGSSPLAKGAAVSVGDPVGTSSDDLYFGLRRGDVYLDPADYLGVVHHRPRLVPSSGVPGRPSKPLPATCPAAGTAR